MRAVVGERVGYASTADVSDAVVVKARASAEVSDADPAGAQLPSSAPGSRVDGLCLPQLTSMPLDRKVLLASDLARRATSLDPRVHRIDTAQWRDDHRRVAVCSTRGVAVAYETAFAELWCDALGEDEHGDANDFSYWWGRDPGEVHVDEMATEAVLLEAVGRALTGGALGNRRSPFAGRQGEQVAAGLVRLVDDGTFPAAPAGAAPFDDEGVPRRRTTLINDGVLTGALHSCATAASVGQAASTGNARRVSHKAAPRAAPRTLRLESSSDLPVEVSGEAAYVQQDLICDRSGESGWGRLCDARRAAGRSAADAVHRHHAASAAPRGGGRQRRRSGRSGPPSVGAQSLVATRDAPPALTVLCGADTQMVGTSVVRERPPLATRLGRPDEGHVKKESAR